MMRRFAMYGLVLGTSSVVYAAISTQGWTQETTTNPTYEVVLRSNLTFQPLNPLRGDKGPQAGVLWGDIRKNVPTGAIIKFTEGFSSPPHIHNITYRAVVISGALHNDDPGAEPMWMGPGSYWTQPAGESHITAAKKGSEGTAFLEILTGPYLVEPTEKAFNNGERPINIDSTNLIWLSSKDTSWIGEAAKSDAKNMPEQAFLWGSLRDGELSGSLVKLPQGFAGELQSSGLSLRAVVIQGTLGHEIPDNAEMTSLEPGSYFSSEGAAMHKLSCTSDESCTIYIRSENAYRVVAKE